LAQAQALRRHLLEKDVHYHISMVTTGVIVFFGAALPILAQATELVKPADGECLGVEACGEDQVESVDDDVILGARTALLQRRLGLHKTHQSPTSLDFNSSVWPCEGLECVKKYTALPDAHYSWQDTGNRISGVDNCTNVAWTGYVLNMTSQKWLTESQVDFPIQWHTMVVVVPENLQPGNWANFIIDFGLNRDFDPFLSTMLNRFSNNEHHLPMDARDVPGKDPGFIPFNNQTYPEFETELTKASFKTAFLATHTQAVTISLFNALNEVQGFADDPRHLPRFQDFIKAYSWIEFLRYGGDEPERIMELAVVKAAVRALDTATAFTGELLNSAVTRFGVTGYSKYGSATWMLGAIDERVKAIAPMALPPIKMQAEASLLGTDTTPVDPSFMSEGPYDRFVGSMLFHPIGAERLMKIVDVGQWVDQVKAPVFYVHATNDEWFSDDLGDVAPALHEFSGPANVLFVNATHDGVAMAGISGIAAFFRGHILGEAMPEISYELNRTSRTLFVKQASAHKPSSVRLYYANSCEGSHDKPIFGEDTVWSKTPDDLPELHRDSGKWAADLGAVAQTAQCSLGAFVRLEYPGPEPGIDAYQISTPAFVLP